MDEKRFDNVSDRMMNMMEKIFKWLPIFFSGFAVFWIFLWIAILILVILALMKYLGLW